MNTIRFFTVVASLCLLSFTVVVLAPFHTESIDGDLSDQFDAPTGPFILAIGDNQITADQQSDDVDYFSITIPDGLVLEELVLDAYTVDDGTNMAFLGMQEGEVFTTDAMSTTGADLLGGITYGSQDLNTNLLIDMMDIGMGYDLPLTAGSYAFWLNQTGPNSEAALNFIVSDNLSLEDIALDQKVQLFPNPVKDKLTIQTQNSTQVIDLSIIDLTGKLMLTYKNPISVDLNELPTGIYFGKVKTDRGIITRKIIKQ